jgi:hypothetical protein
MLSSIHKQAIVDKGASILLSMLRNTIKTVNFKIQELSPLSAKISRLSQTGCQKGYVNCNDKCKFYYKPFILTSDMEKYYNILSHVNKFS